MTPPRQGASAVEAPAAGGSEGCIEGGVYVLPASYGQRRLWFLDRFDPGTPLYNVPVAHRLRGDLDAPALARALSALAARHETLRTAFAVEDGEPVQAVAPPAPVPLPVVDLSGLPAGRRRAEEERRLAAAARRPFDLAAGPLVRALLLRTARHDHALSLVLHHAIADGWSLRVLAEDLSAIYRDLRSGRRPALPELPIQYGDWAAWQREALAGEPLEGLLEFWRGALESVPPVLELPFARGGRGGREPGPEARGHRGERRVRRLPRPAVEALERLAQERGVTRFMAFLALFALLLHRLTPGSGRRDVVVATPVAGRAPEETEGLVGLFVNTLVLRADLGGDPPVGALLKRVRDGCLEAFAHQDLPFERLVEELAPDRRLGHDPLVQALFLLRDEAEAQALRLPGLAAEALPVETGTAKFDLALSLPAGEGGCEARLDFRADRFEATDAARLLESLEALLVAAAADPARRTGELPVLLPAARHQLVAEWNDTAVPYPRRSSIPELFAEVAAARPDAIALSQGGRAWSYAELEARSARLAARLAGLGVAAGTLVGLVAERSPEAIAGLLAILRAGGAYLPLDPEYPPERLAFMLEDGGVAVLLASAGALGRLPAEALGRPGPRVVSLDGEKDGTAGEGGAPPTGRSGAGSLAYVLYTSGSTGRPKGVAVEHRSVVRLVRGADYAVLGGDEVFLQLAPLPFDASTLEIWGPLLNGARLEIFPPGVPSLEELGRAVEASRVTVLWLTAGLFHQMVEAELPRLAGVRQLLSGGDVLSPPHVARVLAARAPGQVLVNGYGPTEGTTFTCCHRMVPGEAPAKEPVPVGRPVSSTRVYLVDPAPERGLAPVPAGVPGELYLGGDGVARGYLGRPALTAAVFVPDPFAARIPGAGPGARLYRTGDLARWLPGGRVDFLGRIDRQVKLRGFRIEPGEVEAALTAHPGVRAAVVTVREDRPGDRRLVAYAVPAEGAGPGAAALRSYLAERLPGHLVPAALVTLRELPLDPNGKVDRRALPAPEGGAEAARERTLPRGPLEELVAGVWSEVLGAGPVGAHDDFFGLGGHSLLATRVVNRLRKLAGVDVPLRRLFEGPTVAELARAVAELRRGSGPGPGASPEPPLVRRRDRETPAPASFSQERLWFLDRLEGGGAAYTVPGGLRLRGPLAAPALAGALSWMAARHEVLRTRFEDRVGAPVQVVAPAAPVAVPVAAIARLPGARREAELRRLARRTAGEPFDLRRGPLLRTLLVRLGPEDHALLLTVHHVVFDGWSLGVFFEELAALYRALAAGAGPEAAALPEPPVQYGDFAAWQREWLSGEVLEEQLAYWRERLAGAPEVLELPADRPRPAARSGLGGRVELRLGPALGRELRALARERGATLFMVLLAGFQALLGRLTGSEDVPVGTPVAGRGRRELERLVGFFVNTLVLRGDLAGEPAFSELVARTREAALAAWARQDVPFERLVEELAPERTLDRSPLVQVVFALQNAAPARPELAGLEAEPLAVATPTAKFDLTLVLREEGDGGLRGEVEYARDLFDATTVRRLARRYETLLRRAAAAPARPLAALDLLDGAERHQLLAEWNDTAVPYPRERTIPELFGEVAAARPEAIALRQGDRWWSYGELAARVHRLARGLSALGVGPDTLVGLAAERSPETIAALLAILEAGGAYLPLDPEYPSERLAFMLEDGAVPVLLASAGALRDMPEAARGGAGTRVVPLETLSEGPPAGAGERTDPPAGAAGPGSLAYVLYTSGSTGRPKGVAVTHRSVVRLVRGADYADLGEEEVFLQLAPMPFDASTLEIWGALLNGGRLELFPPGVPSPGELGRALEAARVSVLWLTAGLFHQMVEAELPRLAGVRQLLAGGDVLSVPHVERVLGRRGPGQVLVNGYGPTEGTTFTCCHRMRAGALPARESVPIGRPISSTRVYLVDPAPGGGLAPAPLGVAGELYLGGDGVARGYLARPGLTAAAFVPDPFAVGRPGAPDGGAGARLYRTGDLARWLPGGEVEFLGRIDGQVKLRGFRIELGEVESVLAGHPEVARAAVVVRDEAGGDRRLAAFVVPADGPPPDVRELRAYLGERLPDYMVPAAFEALDELPLDPNGKVDRRALAARAPAGEGAAPARGRVAPRGPMEELVAGVWSEVLGSRGAGALGVHDDFFDLGGHSLLATRVVTRLRALAGVEVPLRRLFEGPTIAELAAAVEALRGGAAPAGAPALRPRPEGEGPAPASFAQERLWFLDRLEGPGAGAAYNVPGGLRLRGALDAPALARALGRIVARHEVLRVRFEPREEGGVAQVVEPARPVPLPVVDLGRLPAGAATRAAERAGRRLATEPFDLSRGPLVRAVLLRLGADDHVLALTVHHAVFDGWSSGVLLSELSELYAAFRSGRAPVLPDLPIQFGDYAAWQRERLAGAAATELEWWRERLAGVPEVLELPTDRPRPAARSYRGGRRELRLPPALADRLRALGRERGATLFMVLLAGFGSLLSRLTGSEDVPVGTPVAGRSRPELEGLIGLFVNTLVLRTDLSGDPTFGELVARVRDTALDAWARQDLPFEKVVEALAPERALSHSPLFQVMLILQNAPVGAPDLPGLAAEPWAPELPAARLDLTVALVEADGGLRGEAEYDRDLFDPSTVARLAEGFRILLGDGAGRPERRLSELDVFGPAARHQLLVEWNDTGPAGPAPAARSEAPADLLHARVEERAERFPDAVALVAGHGRWSYGELLRRAGLLARRLREAGLGPEERVGVCLERSPDMVVALLAVLRAGGAYVALDPGYPERRLALILGDAGGSDGPPPVLTRERFLDRLPAAARERAVLLEGLDWAASDGAPPAPSPRVAPEALAYLLYTSGSTGRPKGVAVEHRSAAALLDWADRAYTPSELAGTLAATSINFDLSVFELFVPLAAGGTVILAEDALALPGLPAASEVTLVNTVPSAMTELVRMGGLPASVRTVNLAGEPLKRSLAERVHAAAGVERLYNLYGPSEDTTYSTWARVAAGDPGEPTIGRPVTATRAHVLDPRLRPVPVGAVGELCLAGAGLARGYLGRPGQTAERFVPDPLAAAGAGGGRLYRTGDLTRRLPDGELRFLGRMDHQVKLRGFRIELGEIESALLARPEVREAVAVVRRDGGGEEGGARLVAYAVAEEGASLDPEALRRALGEALPGYMVPAAVVVLDELPLTPNRKVDRSALPAPEGGAAPAAGAVPPRDALEEVLAGIWAEVLGRPRVGIRDGFFELGGHSLLAARVVTRVREALGVEVPLRRIFERPTVEGLAAELRTAVPGAEAGARPRLEPVSREGALPASYAQERLWFLDRLDPGTTAYDVPAVFRLRGGLRGSLRAPLLARALREVVRRHEALRTVFDETDGRPVQRILPPPPEGPPAALPLIDLGGLPAGAAEAEAARVAGRSARLAFDLAAGPLYAAWLLRLSATEHRLAWCAHHVAFDGWSLGVLVGELTALYDALRRGRPSPLPGLPVQYADFAAWQRRALGPDALAEQVAWWRERLEGAPRALELPTDRPRPRVQSHRGGRVGTTIEPELLGRLRRLAAGEGSTLFMLLLTALGIVLSRWSGQRDLLVGSPVAGRARSEVEGLIGMFLNTLVLRLDLSGGPEGGPTFRDLLRRARESALGAYAHQDVQLEMLLEELEVERDLSRSPLFQVFLNVLNFPREPVALPDLEVELLDTVQGVESKFDLTLYAAERADGLALELVYAAELFDRPRMAALLEQLRGLLARAAEDPDRPAWGYPLRTGAVLPEPAPRLSDRFEGAVHELFAARAAETPDRPAAVEEGAVWSYGALERAAARLARALGAAGVGRGDRVAVHAARSAALAPALLGILRAGAAFVILDPAHPPRRLAEIVVRARPRALVRLAPAGPLPETVERAAAPLGPVLDFALGGEPAAGPGPDPAPAAAVGADDVAYVAFTSGSTGEPKGIVGRHGPLSHFVPWRVRVLGLSPDDRYSLLSGLAHDPLHRDLFVPLQTGGTVVVPDPERLGDPGWLAGWMARERVTVAHLTPATAQLVASAEPGDAAELPALRRAFFVGEALHRRDVRRLRRLAPAVSCVNHYGTTETQQALASWPADTGGPAEEVVPLGVGAGAVELLVLTPGGAPAGVGELGELAFRSPHLAQGYLDAPAATAERFVPDPFAAAGPGGDRLYRTGDLGRYRPDGAVAFAGRGDHQVQVRGFRVEPGAVEAVLAEHPGVAEVAVVAGSGAGGTRLVAFVKGGATEDELRAHAVERLPDYMVPAAFVPLSSLPRTASGKVDRRSLGERAAESAGAARAEEAPEPPASPAEEVLAGIWREVLEVERVGRRDDFFRLGGHSLLATRVVARVRDALSVELRVRDLFERPRLSDLAARVAELRRERAAGAGAGAADLPGGATEEPPAERAAPLSFAQERLWFLEQLGAGGAAYNMPAALELVGSLDAPALAAALPRIARRHEALRTRFESARGEPRQIVLPADRARLPLPVADLSGLARAAADREARRLAAREATVPFELGRAPLARARLLRLGRERHALLVTLHHIVCDGWSSALFLAELAELYGAASRGEPPSLPELPLQYADFVRRQRELLTGERLAGELAYWRRRLDGAPPVLDLPLDRPRPRLQSYRGGRRWVRVPDRQARALAELARERGATLFMALLAGLQALLWRLTDGQSPPVGTPIAGRGSVESERVIGFFANTLVLYADLADDPPFAELLLRAREATLDAHDHQDLPFERMVEELRPERNLSHSPLFQVMLVFQSAAAKPLELPGLEVRPLRVPAKTARFDLIPIFVEEGGRLETKVEYNRDLLDPTTVDRWMGHLVTLLAGAVRRPEARLSELPLLAEAERHHLLREWNDTRAAAPDDPCLHRLFEERAAELPDAVAVEGPAGAASGGTPLRVTYGELARRAARLAGGLAALGVGPGSRVGVFLGRRAETVVAVLAVLRAGGAYVPLEERWPADRIRYIVDAEGLRVLLTEASRLGRLAELAGTALEHAVCLDRPGPGEPTEPPEGVTVWPPDVLPAPGEGAEADRSGGRREPDPGDLAYVIFTSGSTGRPKGVMVRHRPAVNLVRWVNATFGVGPGDRLLWVTALSFDLSVYDLLGVLAAGATVRIATPEELLDPQRQVRVLLGEPITFWDSAPAALQQLVPFFPEPRDLPHPPVLPALRLAFLSGDWVPLTLPDRLRRSFEGVRLVALGGATEATVWSNWFPVDEIDPDWSSIPYGRPIANARYHVLDRRLAPCPVGVPGDLYIAGECLSTGYSAEPRQTAESYLPDPFAPLARPGGVLYRTGDRARHFPDGTLEFLGRLDTQVKVRGFRIELGEIEAVLAAHPGVAEAVVLARGSGRDAGGDRRLVAYYIPGDPPATEAELLRLAREKLPDYMVPQAFVARESWPLAATGKLDRDALPAPEEVGTPREEEGVLEPPRDGLEGVVAAVWREVLETDRVGREQSFFDLGGHSLLLARVQARLQEELGVPVGMVDLFRHPTVRSLAAHLEWEGAGTRVEEAPAPRAARPPARAPAPAADRRVAVVGLAGRFPGAKSVERFWENLRQGVESIRHFTDEELLEAGFPPEILAEPNLVRAHGVLDDPDLFDAAFFGYSPREAQVIDPQQRLFLEVAWEALEDAGHGGADRGGAVGVFAGVSESGYVREIHRSPDLVRALGPHQIAFSNNPDYVASRVSYKLGLEGPAVNVQAACSTSLVAVHLACLSLLAGDCDLAVAGGAAVRAREVHPYRYEEGGTASPDGRLRAFDARSGGLVGGSGVGAVVLKRLTDALADGDTVRAVILGTAVTNDGSRRIGFTAPGVEGQTRAIRAAQEAAGVAPSSIGYVEAHGTATVLGDPIEIAALTRAFAEGEAGEGEGAREPGERRQWCAIGSVKTNIGHLDAAAGVAGLIKAVLALEHREIPASLHFREPNPEIDFAASPFFVNTRLRPWETEDGRPRRAGISSFGIGGTNAHAVLEEAPAPEEPAEARPARSAELLVLSARTEAALERATEALAAHLETHPGVPAADAAWTLQVGRRGLPWRRAVVAPSGGAVAALRRRDRRFERSGLAPEEPPRVAFLFPGQGAQYPGMGEPLYREEPVFRETLDRCLEVLAPELGAASGEALLDLVQPPAGRPGEEAEERLSDTALTQPLLFAVEYALAELWASWGVAPAAMLGHSLGEYVAATRAGVFELEDALRLVAARGRLMGSLAGGSMLAVRLAEGRLACYLEREDSLLQAEESFLQAEGSVALAAVNGPDACVVSGPDGALAELRARLEAAGVECRGLHTSHAFHSPMMEPAVEPFRELVARLHLRPPRVPFASNVTGAWITREEATDPGYWARQLRSPVRFADGLAAVVDGGGGGGGEGAGWALLEVGPGRTLTTLARSHPAAAEARAVVQSLRHPRQAGSDAERLQAALGALWVAGVEVDWEGCHRGTDGRVARRRVPLPTYPFERRSHWLEGLPMVARSADRPEEAPAAPAAARAGRDELSADEAKVAEVWRDLLGVEELTAGDDFFELGGSSLMAVQLGGRLREAFGAELPSDFLLEASTLGEQAALLGGPAADGEAPRPAPSCRVRIQRGAAGRPQLFAVHQVGGHVYSFRALAKALGAAQPVYGLRSRGLEAGEGEPFRTVEEMAEHYLGLVREVQPDGPYRLAGASMGGMVAFEMAHRLREAGAEVALLALMDTPCGEQMPRRPGEPAEITAQVFSGMGVALTYDELRPLDPDEQIVLALEKGRRAGALGADFDLDQARRLRDVLEANVEALYGYRPRPYPGRLVLYRAEERREQDSRRPELAWIELAAGGLDFVVVPGNHATMHEPPHVEVMARDLGRRLARG